MDVNLNESENPLQYLESSEEEEVEVESDGDEMEMLTSQIDSYYSQYKSDKEKAPVAIPFENEAAIWD